MNAIRYKTNSDVLQLLKRQVLLFSSIQFSNCIKFINMKLFVLIKIF